MKKVAKKCWEEVVSLEQVLLKCCHHMILDPDYNYDMDKRGKIIVLLFEINQKLHLLKMLLKSS